MYNFKYHPDNVILRNNGENERPLITPYADFMVENPDFPIIQGEYFEYGEDGAFYKIISGSGFLVTGEDLEQYLPLINAINNLGE